LVVPLLGRVVVRFVEPEVPVEEGGVPGVTPGAPGLVAVPVLPVLPVVSDQPVVPVVPVVFVESLPLFSVLVAPGVVGSRSVGLKPPIPGPVEG